jgi:sugar phosphate isomerase/epimerase
MTNLPRYAKIPQFFMDEVRLMSRKLALSTRWLHGRFEGLRDFFAAAEAIGFERFELDSSISLKLLAGVSLPEGQIPSLAVPCPAHPRTAAARFASLDRYERDAAREAAQNSFDLAEDLKAQTLIINLGRVDISPNLEDALWEAWKKGGPDSEAVQGLQKELIDLRARHAPQHLQAALYDVEYLANKAVDYGLTIGLLTPGRYSGFPLPEEMDHILNDFGDPVYYWHDVGQAQIFESLGLLPGQVWWDMFAEKTIGLHLNDTRGLTKWLPPQKEGNLPLDDLAAHLPEQSLITCTFSAACQPETISEGLQELQRIFRAS